jgi:hypothetical protein
VVRLGLLGRAHAHALLGLLGAQLPRSRPSSRPRSRWSDSTSTRRGWTRCGARRCASPRAATATSTGCNLHLNFELDEDTRVDSYSQRTSWTCTFARLFEHEQAIWLPAGSTIECECDIDASTHCPRYAVAVRVSHGAREPLRRVGEFSWSGDG